MPAVHFHFQRLDGLHQAGIGADRGLPVLNVPTFGVGDFRHTTTTKAENTASQQRGTEKTFYEAMDVTRTGKTIRTITGETDGKVFEAWESGNERHRDVSTTALRQNVLQTHKHYRQILKFRIPPLTNARTGTVVYKFVR